MPLHTWSLSHTPAHMEPVPRPCHMEPVPCPCHMEPVPCPCSHGACPMPLLTWSPPNGKWHLSPAAAAPSVGRLPPPPHQEHCTSASAQYQLRRRLRLHLQGNRSQHTSSSPNLHTDNSLDRPNAWFVHACMHAFQRQLQRKCEIQDLYNAEQMVQ